MGRSAGFVDRTDWQGFWVSVCVGFCFTRLWSRVPVRIQNSQHTWRIFLSAQARWNMKSAHFLGAWEPSLTSSICSQQFQPKWTQKWWRWVGWDLIGVLGPLFTPWDFWSRNATCRHYSSFFVFARTVLWIFGSQSMLCVLSAMVFRVTGGGSSIHLEIKRFL